MRPTVIEQQRSDVVDGAIVERLRRIDRDLGAAKSVHELLARGAKHAAEFCRGSAALPLAVEDGRLNPRGIGTIAHEASEELRRQALAVSLRLEPGSTEAEVLRRGTGATAVDASTSPLLQALGLERGILVGVAPEDRPLALLVLAVLPGGGDGPQVAMLDLYGLHLASAVGRVVLRARLGEMTDEIRHLTASANAMAHEATTAPMSLTSDYGLGAVFSVAGVADNDGTSLATLLTPRELDVASLMVTGKSNREIAGELHLSPETVKAYVARTLRKLKAANRVQAVSRYHELSRADQP